MDYHYDFCKDDNVISIVEITVKNPDTASSIQTISICSALYVLYDSVANECGLTIALSDTTFDLKDGI